MNDIIATEIIGFMDTVERLCRVKRDIFRKDGSAETDSDHIVKLSFLILMVSNYISRPVNVQRMLELALVHDLVEADTGDISYFESVNNDSVKKLKQESEQNTILKYKSELPGLIGDKIYELFQEYERRETLESKIVKALDAFEGSLTFAKEKPDPARLSNPGVAKRIDEYSNNVFGNAADEDILRAIESIIGKMLQANTDKCKSAPCSDF